MIPKDFNSTFYPTPPRLASIMVSKIKGFPGYVLEPSAGKGALIDTINERHKYGGMNIVAIEKDKDLRSILRGNKVEIIDNDFLTFAGHDKFDLIIGNPPFDNGDKHLMKALDIMYNGQIIFLLNAETINNPHSQLRKELCKRLDDLNAEIEFHKAPFSTSETERFTMVDVALVNVFIKNDITTDLFGDVKDEAQLFDQDIKEKYEVSTGNTIEELVAEYNATMQIATETIFSYYKNYNKIGKYIGLNYEPKEHSCSAADLTVKVQTTVNDTVKRVRRDFWERTIKIKDIASRLTQKKENEFHAELQKRRTLDFTESNVQQLIMNIINGYNDTMMDAVLEIFDKFTVKHAFHENLNNDNVHLFNGWKTNNAFMVKNKVVLPVHGGHYGTGPFIGWNDKWDLHYDAARMLNDIDKVMNFFDGVSTFDEIVTMKQAITAAFAMEKSSSIQSSYFKVTCYKKGTIHLTFTNPDILRRFNVAACKGKNFIHQDYGKKTYSDLNTEEKVVVDSFEGEKIYNKNLGKKLFESTINIGQMLLAA